MATEKRDEIYHSGGGITAEALRQHVIEISDSSTLQAKSSHFPVNVFPPSVREIINATNSKLNFPIDYIGSALLFAASIAIGNTHIVQVMKGFEQNAVLYIALVGAPGANKSHPLSFAVHPIYEIEKKLYSKYQQELNEYKRLSDLARSNKEAIDETKRPVYTKYILSDYTPEALTEIHKNNLRGVGICVDEFAGWYKNFNRYNSGSEIEFWLSAWNGRAINIDRKSGDRILIVRPFIPVVGTIQEALLPELAREGRAKNGFTDRVLFAYPDESKKERWNTMELDDSTFDTWRHVVEGLFNLQLDLDQYGFPKPRVLKFSDSAKKLLYKWQGGNTDEVNRSTAAIGAVYCKMDMYVARFALILELMFAACNNTRSDEISVRAVEGAIELVNYFKRTAEKVHLAMAGTGKLHRLDSQKKDVYGELPNEFTTGTGVQIAGDCGMAERTFKSFLCNKALFEKVKTGYYRKK